MLSDNFILFCSYDLFLLKVCSMPWNDDELSPETNLITEQLEAINKRGVLTINSQPNVNGAPSSDSKVGWGSPNGYIYQKVRICFWITYFLYFETLFKFSSHGIHMIFILYWQAYLEFFTTKEYGIALKRILKNYPQVNYHIVNKNVSECKELSPIILVVFIILRGNLSVKSLERKASCFCLIYRVKKIIQTVISPLLLQSHGEFSPGRKSYNLQLWIQ